jgi:glycerophosphoryl diester phosphodiesterase
MRIRWRAALGGVLLVLVVAYAIVAIRSEPVRPHPFFTLAAHHPLVIAHRGGMHLWPENTLLAFRQATALGADVIEMDLFATADGAIVVLHDPTVDRTTDGTGAVEQVTLAEVRALDAGYRWSPDGGRSFPYRGQGLTIPTLEEVFTALPETRFNLEIKRLEPTRIVELCEMIRGFGAQNRVLLASFDDRAVWRFRRVCPEVATSATPREARRFVALQLFPGTPYVPPASTLQVPLRLGRVPIVTRPVIRAAKAANLQLHAFTVNDAGPMRQLLGMGVDGIVTDRPDLMLQLLGRGE